ncbi:adenosylhomocysteinase [Thermoplasma volcanium GSS1]|uniref:Adenosylhomocysteinase n=1 Tax=Thermoplasma volcanium (strain ATCC 51530 / DSM 4299 / JCM 9571 / NBRC 15438 / GSS1) TaxID=273116 RepID=SAHH_THEVO|nr:RecName: Full=Adenosylhomocysteinase; AltName: Full=S-adenosyl-L-homocysteine hydrolase; Short=AdoHcyase [Thermoplasma volcanium GSS1]BAB60158.1 adenosylhomocysteinase [Thermoplasma volcanium GSS1]
MAEGKGFLRLEWARDHMPVIAEIRKRFLDEKPFKGINIAMALHVEAKTGIFSLLLKEGGANVRMASCNPLSSDDSVVESLKTDYGMPVFARKGETQEEYYENLQRTLEKPPDIIIDDGGDLTKLVHTERKDLSKNIMGGNEETTTGVVRLKAMEKAGVLLFPMFDVNDANMKHLFDNRYGTGQSTLDGIMNSTNLLIAGRNVVVAGYGYCGRGIAMRLKGMGANVIVTEIDPIKANEAIMDGFQVRRMNDAIRYADMVITATGMKDVVKYEDALVAKKNIVLANAGHFDNEVAVKEIEKHSLEKREVREFVKRYRLENGNTVDVIADGRLVNLAAGQGHPVEIMDLSFALQALTAEYLVKNHQNLEKKVYPVPPEIDRYVAEIRLKQFGGELDTLTEDQIKYLNSWDEGT